MTSSEFISNKMQELLGEKYIVLPLAQFNRKYTTARQVEEANNVGCVDFYNDEYTKQRQNHIIGIVSTQNPLRVNTSFYYVTTPYTITFSVPMNNVKTNISGQAIESPKFDFFGDIENVESAVIDKQIQFNETFYGKMTISEPTYKLTESDGTNQFAIFEVSGSVIITDKAIFGSNIKVEIEVNDNYVELDDVNSYNEVMNNDANAIVVANSTKTQQNMAQSNWVCVISIDDVNSDNLARQKIYSIVHENKEIINGSGLTESLKRKLKVRITNNGIVHEFYAIVGITFITTRNGVGSYQISLTDDNKGV